MSDHWKCGRCGMHLLYECPLPKATSRQERLVCSDCHIVFGVVVPSRNRNKRVVCWLISKSDLSGFKGVKKLLG